MIEPAFSGSAATPHSHHSSEDIESNAGLPINPIEIGLPQELRTLSIADRFIRSHEIRLMPELPEANERLQYTTIITSEGLFQLNQEIHAWKCFLDVSILEQLGLSDFMAYSGRSEIETGTLIFDALTRNELTLEQLCTLESAVVDVGGNGVVGYTFNERIWIKLMGRLLHEQYPPKPDDYSRGWLEMLHKPIFQDISLSLKVAIFSLNLFKALGSIYFQENTVNNSEFYTFYKNNYPWVFLGVAALITLNMMLLQGNCFPKSKVSIALNRIRRIEQYMIVAVIISASETFSSILSQIFNSKKNAVAAYLIVPLFMLAIKLGFDSNNDLYTVPALNVFYRPRFFTFLNSFRYALTASSFFSIGLFAIVSDILHFEHRDIDDDYPLRHEANNIMAIIQFNVFMITLLANLLRYPYLPQSIQTVTRYISNISNAMSNFFLGSFAVMLVEYSLVNLFSFMLNEPLAWSQPWSQPVFVGVQPIIYLYAFMTEFPTTSNLPELSIEPMPPEKTWCEAISERIEPITCCLQRSGEALSSVGIFGFIERARRTERTQVEQVNTRTTIQNPLHDGVNEASKESMEM